MKLSAFLLPWLLLELVFCSVTSTLRRSQLLRLYYRVAARITALALTV